MPCLKVTPIPLPDFGDFTIGLPPLPSLPDLPLPLPCCELPPIPLPDIIPQEVKDALKLAVVAIPASAANVVFKLLAAAQKFVCDAINQFPLECPKEL